jgi:hypothetical protein
MRNGIRICKPTSIAYSGTSASIVGQGSVEFSTVTSLSLNGVFTSAFGNYVLVIRASANSATNLNLRFRSSGVDNTVASSYVGQYLEAQGSSVAGARVSSDKAAISGLYSERSDGVNVYFYGPNLAQPTALRSTTGLGYLNAYLYDFAATHSQSSQFDGFTLYVDASRTFTGLVSVYGLVD